MRTIGQIHPFAAAAPIEAELVPGAATDSGAAVSGTERGCAAAGCSTGAGGWNVAVLLGGSLLLMMMLPCCCGFENGS